MSDIAHGNDGRLPVLVGLSATTSDVRWLDLAQTGGSFVISGRRKSGRSEALVTIGRAAIANGVRVMTVTPKESPLVRLDSAERVLPDAIPSLGRTVVEATRPTLLLIDDVDLIDAEHPGLNELAMNPGAELGIVVAGASSPMRMQVAGFVAVLRRARCGLVLCPESGYDSGTFGSTTNLGPEHQFADPPGRGVLGLDAQLDVVQVPLSD